MSYSKLNIFLVFYKTTIKKSKKSKKLQQIKHKNVTFLSQVTKQPKKTIKFQTVQTIRQQQKRSGINSF